MQISIWQASTNVKNFESVKGSFKIRPRSAILGYYGSIVYYFSFKMLVGSCWGILVDNYCEAIEQINVIGFCYMAFCA